MADEIVVTAEAKTAEDNGSFRSPVIDDPYIGTAYGNVLDLYNNPAYNIRIALVKLDELASSNASANAASTSSVTSDTSSPRSDTPSANAAPVANETTVLTKKSIDNKDLIVVAQTGVTSIQVDNLEITSKTKKSAGYTATDISFTLFQPGAANLLDQLQVARSFLNRNKEQKDLSFHFLVEITFKGYTEGGDLGTIDADYGGSPTVVDGPYGWICQLTECVVAVDQTGSTYNFKVKPAHTVAYNDRDYRVPSDFKIEGTTISAITKDLQNKVNEYLSKNTTSSYTYPDIYEFDLSKLVGKNKPLISEEKLRSTADPENTPTGSGAGGDPSARVSTDASSSEKQVASAGAFVPDKTKGDLVTSPAVIDVAAKDDFYNIFVKILTQNDEFLGKVSNLTDINRYGSEADNNKKFLHWISVEMDVNYLQYDKRRNDYQKKIIVRPVVYETARSDLKLQLAKDEDRQISNEEAAATAYLMELRQRGSLLKSYKYIFTGLNDQILNLDIKYDQGAAILQAPAAGLIGDTALATGSILNPAQPIGKDLSFTTAAGAISLISQLKDAKKFAGILNSLKDSAGQIAGIAAAIGRTPEELKNALATGGEKAAKDLAATLDAKTLNDVTKKLSDAQQAAAGTQPVAKNPDGSVYTPEGTSGVIYSEDLVTDVMQRLGGLTLEQITQSGLISASSVGPAVFDIEHPVNATDTVTGPGTTTVSRTASPANSLFNFVYTQHHNTRYLIELNMTVRGDPWYLGNARGKSTADAADLSSASENYFLIQIASPSIYDPDVVDEDKNSGYWNMNNLSFSYSGIYQILDVTNRFSGGIFTTSIKSVKNTGVPLHKIRPLEPGKAVDLTITDEEGNTVDATVAENRDKYLIKAPVVDTTGGAGSSAPVNTQGFSNPLGTAAYTDQGNFGQFRQYYNNGQGGNHQGLDMSAKEGTPIYAAKGGTVVRSGWSDTYGWVVYLDNGDGIQTRYAHMRSDPGLTVGQTISVNQNIGNVGSTGTRSSGPHLHFEVRQGNSASSNNNDTKPIDPRPFITGN